MAERSLRFAPQIRAQVTLVLALPFRFGQQAYRVGGSAGCQSQIRAAFDDAGMRGGGSKEGCATPVQPQSRIQLIQFGNGDWIVERTGFEVGDGRRSIV